MKGINDMQKNTVTFEGAKLKKEADENEMFQLISFYCADRERNAAITDINQMKNILIRKGEKIDSDKYYKAWKRLEDIGAGSLILGRNERPTRFKWNYSLKAIGQAAITGKDIKVSPIVAIKKSGKVLHTFPLVDKTRLKSAIDANPGLKNVIKFEQPETPAYSTNNVVFIQLRPDFVFETNLPKLSESEADMLCKAIRRCV